MTSKKPIISLIAAMAKGRVIGLNNQMPWHLPADLKHFKETTMNKPIVMGRKTFDSIGKPLPGRRNIIITRNTSYSAPGIETVGSLEEAIELLKESEEIIIGGGGNIYQQTLEQADRLYLTFIDLETEGDAFFPEFEHLNLRETARVSRAADEKNPHACQFVNYDIV
ncbi:type 3 dihydrofolate reductase [Pleionea sp. CnH1-48]|uniref:type 3 dihydrofolate reductase n=1 Tax=Pleionea sp. CnH1-48 TaxID=2954494 RepID=UPI0020971311|nr:type 3 dihydrofolate reductase [Pleionea sp. CnH1-48]MCO7224602.1 type 3 dihydrofolate reductase [Pleionea sp. CnH1-48]